MHHALDPYRSERIPSLSLSRAPSDLFIPTPPARACEMCVVVPVRDEARMLAETLRALADQCDLHGAPFDHARYEVIVFANNCTDDSAALARAFAARHPLLALHIVERIFPAGEIHVGRARRMLMDAACCRLASDERRGVIASTDGDTRVAPTWIAATLREIARGADAVGGRILTEVPENTVAGRLTRQYHLRDVGYRHLVAEMESLLDPDPYDRWPRHHQHFGASLAVTTEAYIRVGRLPVLPALEDVAFYHALRRVDARVRHSPAVRVRTSPRLTGRTAIGLAQQLREWTTMGHTGQPHRVESAMAIEARVRARYALRRLWRQADGEHTDADRAIATVASELGIEPAWLRNRLAQPQAFGALLEQVEERQAAAEIWMRRWPPAEITETVHALRVRLSALRNCATPSAAHEEIEPIALAALAREELQLRFRPRDERLVHGVAGERVIRDMGSPVDEQQMTAG